MRCSESIEPVFCRPERPQWELIHPDAIQTENSWAAGSHTNGTATNAECWEMGMLNPAVTAATSALSTH